MAVDAYAEPKLQHLQLGRNPGHIMSHGEYVKTKGKPFNIWDSIVIYETYSVISILGQYMATSE